MAFKHPFTLNPNPNTLTSNPREYIWRPISQSLGLRNPLLRESLTSLSGHDNLSRINTLGGAKETGCWNDSFGFFFSFSLVCFDVLHCPPLHVRSFVNPALPCPNPTTATRFPIFNGQLYNQNKHDPISYFVCYLLLSGQPRTASK